MNEYLTELITKVPNSAVSCKRLHHQTRSIGEVLPSPELGDSIGIGFSMEKAS